MRWLDALTLEGLERLVVASPCLQRAVMHVHERALRRLLPSFAHARTVLVVGGGLFPRTTLLLRRLLPQAQLTIVDVSAAHLQIARSFLGDDVVCRAEFFGGDAVEKADLGMDAIVARQQFDRLEDAGVIGGETESSFGIDEASTVSRMLEWVDTRDRRRPFLLVYLPIAGHHPYAAPEPLFFRGTGPLVAYRNALRHADASVATLLDGLRSRGLEDGTLFVLFGDHGEAFGQHDGNIGHTLFIFEENVRVPLLISVPGVTARPVRSTRIASVVDIAPTVLDMLGLPRPLSYEGVSLLNGPPAIAYFAADYALAWAGLRDGCWKYLLELETARSRLYDICGDPGERHNLVAAHAARESDYRRRVRGWAAATRHSYTDTSSPHTSR